MATKDTLFGSFDKAIKFILTLWVVHFTGIFLNPGTLSSFGVYPREYFGLKGIAFFTFIHGDFLHLISNSLPLFLFLLLLFQHYQSIAKRVVVEGMLITGFLVWCFARQNYHIGASGLVYALAGFLIGSGFYRKENKSFFLSLIILVSYGSSMFSGLLPLNQWISWEAHLFGGITGIYLANKYKQSK